MSNEEIFLNLLTEKLYFRWEVSEGTTDGVKCQFYSWKYWGKDNEYYSSDSSEYFLESLEELVEDVLKHLVISYEPR